MTHMLRSLSTALALALIALAAPSVALASGDDVIRDCADDGVIDGDYSERELREAERDLPSDIDEYTDCREAIRAERGGGAGSSGSSGGGGRPATDPNLVTPDGAVASTRDDIDALNELSEQGRSEGGDEPAIDVGGTQVTPGDSAGGQLLGAANAANELPMSMLSALILLVLSAVAGTALLIRRRGLPAPLAAGLGKVRAKAPGAPAFLSRVKRPRIFRR